MANPCGVDDAVDESAVSAQGDGDPGLLELSCVRFALVAQRVEAGDSNIGRRQSGEGVGEQGEARGSSASVGSGR